MTEQVHITEELKYHAGDKVCKPNGYPFDGVVVSSFYTLAGKPRYVVDNGYGMLHIFNAEQLAPRG